MPQGEQEPTGERENSPQISFNCVDKEYLETFSWQPTANQLIMHVADQPFPLKRLKMMIDGPRRHTDGGDQTFVFHTEVELEEDPESNLPSRFLDGFVQSFKEAYFVPTEGSHSSYLLVAEKSRLNYLVHANNDSGTNITIASAGSGGDKEPTDQRVLRRLSHDEHDFQPAFFDHLAMTKKFITDLYSSYGYNDVQLTFDVPQIEALEEDQYEEEEPLPNTVWPEVTMADLGGLQHVKEQLMDTVLALQHSEVVDAWQGEHPHGIFLYGPAGTGKTSLAHAVAHEIGAVVRQVKSSDIYGKWMGESETKFQQILDEAREADQTYVLLFDEIDGILRKDGGSAYATVATLFKQQIGTISEENPNVVVIATSNKTPDEIDESMFRSGRFDTRIYVPLPDEENRSAIFMTLMLDSMKPDAIRQIFDLEQIDFGALIAQTDGMSGADIREVIRKTKAAKIRQEIYMKLGDMEGLPSPITTEDLLKALQTLRAAKA